MLALKIKTSAYKIYILTLKLQFACVNPIIFDKMFNFSDLEVEKDVNVMLIPQNEAKEMRDYMKIRKFWM